MSGISTPNLPGATVIDELLGNQTLNGVQRTVRVPAASLAQQLAASGPIRDAISVASEGLLQFATWAELSSVAPAKSGQPARVRAQGGTHVDPVTGATEPDPGEYSGSMSPLGWRRVGDLAQSAEEVTAEVVAARSGAPTLADKLATLTTQEATATLAADITAVGQKVGSRLQLVGTCGSLPRDINTNTGGGGTVNHDARLVFRNGLVPASNLRVVVPNITSSETADVDGLNPITVAAAMEAGETVGATAGLTKPFTFSGEMSKTIDGRANPVVSDPIGGVIEPYRLMALRLNARVASGALAVPTGYAPARGYLLPYDAPLDVFSTFNDGASVVFDKGLSSTDVLRGYTPLGLIGEVSQPAPAVAIHGDSIAYAQNDDGTDRPAGSGFGYGRGLALGGGRIIPSLNIGRGGMRVADLANALSSMQQARRLSMLPYVTHVLSQMGANDYNLDVSAALMRSRFAEGWSQLSQAGPRVAAVLVTPRTASTDGWASAANQSIINPRYVPGGIRDQVNAWIKTQVGLGLIHYAIDLNPYLEDPANPGYWRTDLGPLTDDGLHPNALGYKTAAPAIRAWGEQIAREFGLGQMAGNLLANSSFEDGTVDWANFDNVTRSVLFDTTNSRVGRGYAYLNKGSESAGSGSLQQIQQTVSGIEVGATYRLGCWAKANAATAAGFRIAARWLDSGGTTVSAADVVNTGYAVLYTDRHADVVAPAGAASLRIEIKHGTEAAARYAFVDDAYVVKIS